MAIITVSRGCFSRGKEVAERVAERLGYRCVSREVLHEASRHYDVTQTRLEHALHDAPSFFERQTYARERQVAYIRAEILELVSPDNAVYHGLAGHFFFAEVSHALTVRIIADLEDRVRREVEREEIDEAAARRRLLTEDDERRKWSQYLYGIDTHDSSLYDMCLNVSRLTLDRAVSMICEAARLPQLQATPASLQHLEDLALAARTKAALASQWPAAEVSASSGQVHVKVPIDLYDGGGRVTERVRTVASMVDKVAGVTIDTSPRRAM